MTPAATEGTYAMALGTYADPAQMQRCPDCGLWSCICPDRFAVGVETGLRAAAIILHRDADRLARMAAGNPHAAELLGAERRGYRLAMATLQGVMTECGRPDLARAFHPDTRPL